MSDMPPEQPAAPPPPPPPPPSGPVAGYSGIGRTPVTGAILPVPGNAELAVFFVILVFLIVIWAATDALNAGLYSILMTVLTSFYLLSRGIAKASRVLEQ
ncbi:MAG: hypothetical protein V7644_2274 [Actinomycetota bacterium]|jgi:hypothetical protein